VTGPDDTRDLAEAFRGLSHDAAYTEACPDADAIWDAAVGDASAEQTARIIDHTSTCGACAEAWRLARAVDDGADELGAARSRKAHASRRSWIAGAVAISAAAAVLVFALARRGGDETGDPVIHRGVDSAIEALIADDTALETDAFELSWKSVGDRVAYDVVVTTEQLTIVDRADGLTVTTYTVPAAKLTGIEPGARLFWRVHATLPDGRRVTSAMFAVRLK
jgi:hypothetical protein